ncbi:zf-HC2 domain-containing protein [Streptomyces iconiensis]|uniref:Zf-HC2 domain-containing protein n=2 Tax=Streptomyces iconiensis TaxID=1384038 RepID=A0ABT6ZYC6_9ACTN|nr:zf-HC2 domain-containing protein [Streptomyces iconiensis]MDJ1134061.1 zf-HC2 domain-containing protein [Streptomyces iconiensis]
MPTGPPMPAAPGGEPPAPPPTPAGYGHGAPGPGGLDHKVLKSLLGAWALAACSAEETAAVEAHLTDCATCAEEALRLRDAVGLLHAEDSLDLDPMLRTRVLEGCLVRRPPRIPVPDWAAPYDAETARLDALLRDMADAEWRAPVRLRWFDGEREAERDTTVAGVIGHLFAVDGLVAPVLGLPDPLRHGEGPGGPARRSPGEARGAAAFPGEIFPGDVVQGPVARTEAFWALDPGEHHTAAARELWRDQGHAMIRHVSFAEGDTADFRVSYGEFDLPLHDAFLDRAFECWMHAEDIADAVDYPYGPPAAGHLNLLVDLAARQLPGTIAGRRRAGLAPPPRKLAAAGAPGRTLHLEVEGSGGGHWYIPLDSPGADASPEEEVAHVALDGLEFCQLAAGHVPPQDAAAGQDGDREAIRDVLFAAASLSRL